MSGLLLLAAPSGAGKNSFLSRALRDFPSLMDITTFTTREPRTGEVAFSSELLGSGASGHYGH